jgi:hypothetical protein
MIVKDEKMREYIEEELRKRAGFVHAALIPWSHREQC